MVAVEALKRRLSELDDAGLERLVGRSLLRTAEWELRDLVTLLELAEAFEALDRRHVRAPLLSQELAYALFLDPSTRTRSTWAGAAARLGMQPVVVDGASLAAGETAAQIGAVLGMNAHALGVRHELAGRGAPFLRDVLRGLDDYLKATNDPRPVPLVNLGSDEDHPSHTLGDLLWLREVLGRDLRGRRVAVTWAHAPRAAAGPSALARGLLTLLPRFGAEVVLAHPEGFELEEPAFAEAEQLARQAPGSLSRARSLEEAFRGAAVVYPLCWAPSALLRERAALGEQPEPAALRELEARAREAAARHASWRCDEDSMGRTADAVLLHTFPADGESEATPAVLERFRTQVARQANKKVYALMALLAAAKVRGLWGRLQQLLD